ncbi:hemerythrin domain-containing protein [Desulfonatronum thioautotrophicum]|uniref:hemerythrin domain-containing protein n=1 Tax=Desulfonatronum thioautotrophicum TaxID=617001 RepID=UPI0005EB0CBF|nr:hemerythrin domain-containing protein [Desulfonatronum thioautotrophicum]
MQSRAILMIEHRLIERMVDLVEKTIYYIKNEYNIDPIFIGIIIDFIQTYADQTHHGKEEDILFKVLKDKEMSRDDKELMNELIEEHVFGRKIIHDLSEANRIYRNGERSALNDILKNLDILKNFYPKHIEKEDEKFFPNSMKYLSDKEDQKLLDNYYEFDKNMIHEKYITVIDACEKQLSFT